MQYRPADSRAFRDPQTSKNPAAMSSSQSPNKGLSKHLSSSINPPSPLVSTTSISVQYTAVPATILIYTSSSVLFVPSGAILLPQYVTSSIKATSSIQPGRRSNFTHNEDLVLLREVAASKAHIAPTGETRERF